jgi:hypothetical protein
MTLNAQPLERPNMPRTVLILILIPFSALSAMTRYGLKRNAQPIQQCCQFLAVLNDQQDDAGGPTLHFEQLLNEIRLMILCAGRIFRSCEMRLISAVN